MYRNIYVGVALALGACAANGPAAERDLAADTASLPNTEIFLSSLSLDGDAPEVTGLRNITQHAGYDNQPSFLPGAAAFYYVSEGASGKTDIWLYDIAENANVRIYASSAVSEYSPKAAPDGYGVSYIQENAAGDVTRVHHAPASGGAGEPVIDFAPLGYYAWLAGGETLGVFLRSEPATLHLVDVASGANEEIASDIGRGLQPSPDGGRLYFTTAMESDVISPSGESDIHMLKVLNLADRSVEGVAVLPFGAREFSVVFDSDGAARGVFTGPGAELHYLALDKNADDWRLVRDFGADNLGDLTRIAVSDDSAWIAFVVEVGLQVE